MEFIIGLIVVVAVWFFFLRKSSEATKPRVVDLPIRVTVTTSSGGDFTPEKINTGTITQVADGFILNPKSPLPLTITGASRTQAETIKEALDKDWVDYKLRQELAFLIAQHNLRCKEIDAYVVRNRTQFLPAIERMKAESAEWAISSEKDRSDLLRGFQEQALEGISERPSQLDDLRVLLSGAPADVAADDELVALFGQDVESYKSYVYSLSSTASVRVIPADDYWRKRYETFVQKGLARRGLEIPLSDILESLRLKEINQALLGTVEKPFGRKAKAVEFALTVPDMKERLGKLISFRELFQVLQPQGLDISNLQKCFAYATATANLFCETYATGVRTLRTLSERREMDYKGWRIDAEDCCSGCNQYHNKTYKTRPSKLPPYHIGCSCQVEGQYE